MTAITANDANQGMGLCKGSCILCSK